jgi:hypothetical protein
VVFSASCAAPVYVRKADPVTPADSARVYADSLAWVAEQKHKQNQGLIMAVAFGLLDYLVILPLIHAR